MDRSLLPRGRALYAGTSWLALALVSTCGLTGCSRQGSEPSGRPNVLLVTLDTTRADRLGCYGASSPRTPNLDGLAREGVRFDLAISQAAVTPTSHASIFTGLYPYQHGLRVFYAKSAYRLPESVPTLASLLRDAGWHTAAFLSSFTVSEHFGFDRGFEVFDNGLRAPGEMYPTKDGVWMWDIMSNQRRSDTTADRAIDWLHRRPPGPFLMWIHFWDPHDEAVLPPADFLTQLVPPGTPPKPKGFYDAEVAYVDRQFGRVVQALKDSGEHANTVIVVVADHGEGLGDHGWLFHRILYQEQIRVPLIIRVPGGPSERVVEDLVRSVDILPTVLEVAGLRPPAPIEGVSLLGLMQGRPEPPRLAYADALNVYDLNSNLLAKRPNDDLLHCAMDRSWKLIYRPSRPDLSELYNIDRDPAETRNLYESEVMERERLVAVLQRSGGFVDRPFGEGSDPEALERLRSLGYTAGGSK